MIEALENFLMDLMYSQVGGKRDFKNGIELKLPPFLFELMSINFSQEMENGSIKRPLIKEKIEEGLNETSAQFITYMMANGITFKIVEDI